MKLENTIIDITERFLESHALIAERQGMVAENQLARERGEEPTYIKGHFDEVAKKLRALKSEEEKPAHSTNNVSQKCLCDSCQNPHCEGAYNSVNKHMIFTVHKCDGYCGTSDIT